MSSSLTFISLSHDNDEVYVWRQSETSFVCFSAMTSVWSRGLSHSHAHWKLTQSEVELLKPNYNTCYFCSSHINVDLILCALYATSMSNHVSFNLGIYWYEISIVQASVMTCTSVTFTIKFIILYKLEMYPQFSPDTEG